MLSNEMEIFQHLSFCNTHHSTQTVLLSMFLLKASNVEVIILQKNVHQGFMDPC